MIAVNNHCLNDLTLLLDKYHLKYNTRRSFFIYILEEASGLCLGKTQACMQTCLLQLSETFKTNLKALGYEPTLNNVITRLTLLTDSTKFPPLINYNYKQLYSRPRVVFRGTSQNLI